MTVYYTCPCGNLWTTSYVKVVTKREPALSSWNSRFSNSSVVGWDQLWCLQHHGILLVGTPTDVQKPLSSCRVPVPAGFISLINEASRVAHVILVRICPTVISAHYLCFVLDLRSLPAFLFVSGLMLGPENTSAFNRSVFATT